MCQSDLSSGGRFEDIIAYGGWTMDDHNPAGFLTREPPTVHYPAPSPYGIPYRCLYSRNIDNLMFAGRNISVTHAVASSTRVMATCALLGQAAGTAAAIAVRRGLTPRGVYEHALTELKQTLMDDDSYLPFNRRAIPEITRNAQLVCAAPDSENLRNGLDRPIDNEDNGCVLHKGESVEYRFDKPVSLGRARIIFDSDLNNDTLHKGEKTLKQIMMCNRPRNWPDSYVPKSIVKSYRLDAINAEGDVVHTITEELNYKRLRTHAIGVEASAIRLTPLDTWGAECCHVFSFDVE